MTAGYQIAGSRKGHLVKVRQEQGLETCAYIGPKKKTKPEVKEDDHNFNK